MQRANQEKGLMYMSNTFRSIKRSPIFSFALVLTLSVGITTAGVAFSIVYSILLSALPYDNSERLVDISVWAKDRWRTQGLGHYLTYERLSTQLQEVGLYKGGGANVRTGEPGAEVENVSAAWVTASVMRLLAVRPLVGRWFIPEEEVRGGQSAVMISEVEWRDRFGASPAVVGETLIVNDAPRVIVGVMPSSFAFPSASVRVWLPIRQNHGETMGDLWYAAIARLAPGASVASAEKELSTILPRAAEFFPRMKFGGATAGWLEQTKPRIRVTPLKAALTERSNGALWILTGVSGFILLAGWASAAGLMVARVEARRLEFSVREALGGRPLSAALHLLREISLLGAVAAALALAWCYLAVRAFVLHAPLYIPRLSEVRVGGEAVGVILVVTVLGILVCTVLASLQSWRTRSLMGLQGGARGFSSGVSSQRIRKAVIVFQVALALGASVGSTLLLRTIHELYSIDPGFKSEQVQTARILLPTARYRDDATVEFFGKLTELVAQLPGVHAAGLTMQLPISGRGALNQEFLTPNGEEHVTQPVNVISNGYFDALRIPFLAGRDFRPLDSETADSLILSRSAVRSLLGERDPTQAVGRLLSLAPSGPTYTVVGVVPDIRNWELASPGSALVYRPQLVPLDAQAEPGPQAAMTLVLRSSSPISQIMPRVGDIVRSLDATVVMFDVRTMTDVLHESMAETWFILALVAITATIVLLLAGIGLYGLMAYTVTLRARELATRSALGASTSDVVRLVSVHGLRLTGWGFAFGGVACFLVIHALSPFLYNVKVWDPVAIGLATLAVFFVSIMACLLPSLRAARTSLANALRGD